MSGLLKQRWLWVAAILVVVNSGGWWWLQRQTAAAGRLQVQRVIMMDPELTNTPLTVQFNQPMVPAAAIGEAVPAGWLAVSPTVIGSWEWLDTSTARLRLDEPLVPATAYALTVSPQARAAAGAMLAEPYETQVETPRLAVQRVDQAGYTDNGFSLRIHFNYRVDPAALMRHLEVTDATGYVLFRDAVIAGEPTRQCVLTDSRQGLQGPLTVRIDAALAAQVAADGGEVGPLGLGEDYVQTLSPDFSLAVHGISTYGESISFTSNQLLDPAVISDYVVISPTVKTTISRAYGGRYRIAGAFEAGRRYRVQLRAGMPSAFGQVLAADVSAELTMGSVYPSLDFTTPGLVLWGQGQREVTVKVRNIKEIELVVRRIYPQNVMLYWNNRSDDRSGSGYGEVVARTSIPIATHSMVPQEVPLPLGQLLPLDSRGAFVLEVRSTDGSWARDTKLLVVTDLALSCRYAGTEALVRANGLSDARPRAGVRVQVLSTRNLLLAEGLTDAQGLAHFRDLPWTEERQPGALVATSGDDFAFLPLDEGALEQEDLVVGDRPYLKDGYEALVYTDRGICRPGETIRLQAVLRDAARQAPTPFPVVFAITDPRGRPLVKRTAMPDANGLASTELAVGDYGLTGRYKVALQLPGEDGKVLGESSFQVETYMPDRLEVSFLDLPTERVTPESLRQIGVQAKYLHGAPAAGATLALSATVQSAPISQPRWPGFGFGDAQATASPVTLPLGERPLDADGLARVPIRVPTAFGGGEGAVLELRASVTEPGGRAVTRTARLPLDFQAVLLGLQRPEGGLAIGTEYRLPCIAVTPGGEPAGDLAAQATLLRHDWQSVLERDENGRARYISRTELVEVEIMPVALTDGRGVVPITVPRWGYYTLRLESPQGATAAVTFYAFGRGDEPGDMSAPHRVELSAVDTDPQPGADTAIRVQSPFTGTALVTVESDRIHWYGLRELPTRTSVIQVPLPATDLPPNVYVTVAVLRPGGPTGDWAGHRAYGALSLNLPASAPELTATLSCEPEMRPGRDLPVTLRVQAGEQPAAGASVSLAVVDMGILNLTSYRPPNPFEFFLSPRRMVLRYSDLYDLLMPEPKPQQVGMNREFGGGFQAALAKADRYMNPVSVRRVESVAWSRADLVTDARGEVHAAVPVPAEFTGRLRVMAVVASRDSGGVTATDVVVREPFMLEAHLPRVLAPGDRFAATVALRNDTDKLGLATLTVDLDGMEFAEKAPVDVELAAGESSVLTLALRATERIGAATAVISATLDGARVSRRVELAVRPAGPLLTDWGTAIAEPGKVVRLAPPADWLPGTVRRQYVASNDPLLQLGGGMQYLLRYPYGCLEQTSSAMIAMIYLPALTGQVDPQLADAVRHRRYVQAGVDRIFSMQLPDGSFSMWPGGNTTWKWGTIWATQILQEAQVAGFNVSPQRLDAARAYLLGIDDDDSYRAAAAWVLLQRPGTDPAPVRRLIDTAKPKAGTIGEFYLLAARAMLHEDSDLRARAEALIAADSEVQRQNGGMLDSATRRDAVMLLTLMRFQPDSDVLARLSWRLSRRAAQRGHWGTTQDNGLALMALGKYLQRTRPAAGDPELDFSMDGRSVARGTASTIGLVACNGDADVDLQVLGEGSAYYAWVQTGVSSEPAPAVDQRLRVRRRYLTPELEAIDPADVKQGQLLVVALDIRADSRTENVVITDLLPAGLEIENPRLATRAGAFARLPKSLVADHVDMRDDRLLLFLTVPDVEQHYYYVVRAVTAGAFALPPVTAECMYDPDIRSLHGGGKLMVTRHD